MLRWFKIFEEFMSLTDIFSNFFKYDDIFFNPFWFLFTAPKLAENAYFFKKWYFPK